MDMDGTNGLVGAATGAGIDEGRRGTVPHNGSAGWRRAVVSGGDRARPGCLAGTEQASASK